MIEKTIKKLLDYAIKNQLLKEEDSIFVTNRILEVLQIDDYTPFAGEVSSCDLEEILKEFLDYAAQKGLLAEDTVVYRDLFDTKIMACLLPLPSQVREKFWQLYEDSPQKATDYFYKFSQDSDYIRRYRIKKDKKWTVDSDYGEIDITINLSKPEKDPKAIAAAKTAKQSGYPKCLLCVENEGFAGNLQRPARQNHRIIPIDIQKQDWAFQYSPYVYYNEHCIVFNQEHIPMKIDASVFAKLLDFVRLFPHYFIGSNADLPIVGGSILSHEHFQGGNYTFAMAKAPVKKAITVPGFEDVSAGILHWPLSVIRIRHKDADRLIRLADHILSAWRGYSSPEDMIFAKTDGSPHNTITPIARMKDGEFELDLALRNNLTTEEHPLGLYHPHEKLHHIKKENIGLIEVMGLAVLPARLKEEMELLADCLLHKKDYRAHKDLEKHADWVDEFLPNYPVIDASNVTDILQKEIGLVFTKVLEDAGVFKSTPEGLKAFERFVESL